MSTNLHDRDFYEWTRQQTNLLRTRDFARVDLENLIEEISSLGECDKREAHKPRYLKACASLRTAGLSWLLWLKKTSNDSLMRFFVSFA
ncbi:MAG: DUF29 family protein [Methylococcaceae bacterium]|nr:DUF29 family protein [Methylococcaceae bacterium]